MALDLTRETLKNSRKVEKAQFVKDMIKVLFGEEPDVSNEEKEMMTLENSSEQNIIENIEENDETLQKLISRFLKIYHEKAEYFSEN